MVNHQAMDDVVLYAHSCPLSGVDEDECIQNNSITRETMDPKKWGISPPSEEEERHLKTHLKVKSARHWINAKSLQYRLGIDELPRAVAAFVRDGRAAAELGARAQQEHRYRAEDDLTWAENIFLSLHTSVVCWRRDGADTNDSERLVVKSHARCQPCWNGIKDSWRNDYVWVRDQTSLPGEDVLETMRFSTIGQLVAIMQLVDPDRMDQEGPREGKASIYTGVLLRRKKWVRNGAVHAIHGMAEVEPWPVSTARNPRTLGEYCIFDITQVQHLAHLVPRGKDIHDQTMLVNNWIDFENYNRSYDPDFINSNKAAARKYARGLDKVGTKP